MQLGFTGTRSGMTEAQQKSLRIFLRGFLPDIGFHHGDCIGADGEAHDIAELAGLEIYIHPPLRSENRAFRYTDPARMRPEKPYLDRNKDIVLETQALIAAPAEPIEQLRSGTWSTVRYAHKLSRPIILILPDGTIQNLFQVKGKR